MPRPFCCRSISGNPAVAVFKPVGIPVRELEEVVMTLDEFEAMRLADLEGLYHERAAHRMKVSRPTFSRIIDSARRKTADAIVHGKALRIEGGVVQIAGANCSKRYENAVIEPEKKCPIRQETQSVVTDNGTREKKG